jgi:peptidoglycan/LPS O-acetylase OafA/YrhL
LNWHFTPSPLYLASKLLGDRGYRLRKLLASFRSIRPRILQRRHRLPLLSVRVKSLLAWFAELFLVRLLEQKEPALSWALCVLDGSACWPGCPASPLGRYQTLSILCPGGAFAAGAFRFFGPAQMGQVGDLSYPLYLVHWPILVFAVAISQLPHMAALGQSQAYPYALIAISLIASHAINQWIVTPLDSWRQARIQKSATEPAEVAISTTAQPATG